MENPEKPQTVKIGGGGGGIGACPGQYGIVEGGPILGDYGIGLTLDAQTCSHDAPLFILLGAHHWSLG